MVIIAAISVDVAIVAATVPLAMPWAPHPVLLPATVRDFCRSLHVYLPYISLLGGGRLTDCQ